jgi:cyclopropane fatty-acyl-phospholipid synthase-like methyltransferase
MSDRLFLEEVKNYYNKSQKWYTWFYSDRESLGMHYGFWDSPTTTRVEALINPYRVIKQYLNPQAHEVILDAGCGVGGASLWLATQTNASYVGITLSEVQLQKALRHRKQRNLEEQTTFLQRNYFETGFKDNQFDKIFGLESFCYSYPNSIPLYQEMYRVLKPHGKLIILDGIFLRKPKDEHEENLAKDFCKGFRLATMNTTEQIISQLIVSGFKNVNFIDKSREIKSSVDDLYKKGLMVSPFRYLKYIGLVTQLEVDNLLATRTQKEMYEKGLYGYGVFLVEKF